MNKLHARLNYLEWAFWGGGALFLLVGGFVCVLISQELPLAANNEWIPRAGFLIAGIGLLVCIGARVTDRILVNRALADAYAQIQKSEPGARPNEGQLAMLAGLPDSRMWQARAWLGKNLTPGPSPAKRGE